MTGRFLVVGAGVAGLCLARELEAAGAECLTVADPADPGGATAAAIGLVNPLAGLRWARPWRSSEARETAVAAYGPAWQWRDLVRLPARRTDWPTHLAADGWEARPLPADFPAPAAWPAFDPTGAVLVTGAVVPVAAWAESLRAARHAAGRHLQQTVSPDDLAPDATDVNTPWGRFTAAIFATGAALASDPRWSWIPWQRSAGARVNLATPSAPANPAGWPPPILAGRTWLCPTEDPTRWELGATTVPLAQGAPPPPPPPAGDAARTLWSALAERPADLPAGWQVTRVLTGVRLALQDRRPLASRHPRWPSLAVLAGFGGRGVLHAPWAAARLADHLLHGAALPVDLTLRPDWPRQVD